ncbi:MAG: riboflavin synthase [Eubacterium sp.]|nr:riboflavin synthase [Eubacterium sp.]NBI86603.1 riboflavin synthase [Lachnospiraceae bacterium]
MFTGIIEEMGEVLGIKRTGSSAKIQIRAKRVLDGTKTGDSIAVNGVCLTVTEMRGPVFSADVMPETLVRSSLGHLKAQSRVNLERAMAADGRFGGHIVSGHIDGTGTIGQITKEGNAVRYRIAAEPGIMRGIVEKGSIAIDGISLTVTMVQAGQFEVSVIPHTLSETTLAHKKQGEIVNLENDVIGKYVERLLFFEGLNTNTPKAGSAITKEFLLRAGF